MTTKKGIILAGGNGTRLHPATLAISKQLLPIYDKPMVYYPLTTLMQAGIQDILVICKKENLQQFLSLFNHGQQWGIQIKYAVQDNPNGIAEALLIAAACGWLNNEKCALILGDNLFYGPNIKSSLVDAAVSSITTIFAYEVSDPERYGVVCLEDYKPTQIIEKPTQFVSKLAVTGLYFYDEQAVSFVKSLTPSARGELEITDLNNIYLKNKKLNVEILGNGSAWLDMGTHDALLEASQFVSILQKRQGIVIGDPESTAKQNRWI